MSNTTTYILDKNNRIISVKGPWDEFADENKGENTSASDVKGKYIWNYVVGDSTKMWLEAIFQIVRLKMEAIERPYRCDSPYLKRYMTMRIIPEEDSKLRIEHEVVSIEQRPEPVRIKYGKRKPLDNIVIRCSMCGRIQVDENWQEPRKEHAKHSHEITVAYSVCQDCQRLLPSGARDQL